jgi:hypothetical protein
VAADCYSFSLSLESNRARTIYSLDLIVQKDACGYQWYESKGHGLNAGPVSLEFNCPGGDRDEK